MMIWGPGRKQNKTEKASSKCQLNIIELQRSLQWLMPYMKMINCLLKVNENKCDQHSTAWLGKCADKLSLCDVYDDGEVFMRTDGPKEGHSSENEFI